MGVSHRPTVFALTLFEKYGKMEEELREEE